MNRLKWRENDEKFTWFSKFFSKQDVLVPGFSAPAKNRRLHLPACCPWDVWTSKRTVGGHLGNFDCMINWSSSLQLQLKRSWHRRCVHSTQQTAVRPSFIVELFIHLKWCVKFWIPLLNVQFVEIDWLLYFQIRCCARGFIGEFTGANVFCWRTTVSARRLITYVRLFALCFVLNSVNRWRHHKKLPGLVQERPKRMISDL